MNTLPLAAGLLLIQFPPPVAAAEANELVAAATQGLSNVSHLCVEDGAVGTGVTTISPFPYHSHPPLTRPSPAAGASDVSVRVISDSAAVAAYARVVLAGSPPRHQRPVVTAYVLTSMTGR